MQIPKKSVAVVVGLVCVVVAGVSAWWLLAARESPQPADLPNTTKKIDTTPPEVTLTDVPSEAISGTVAITALVQDDTGVKKVEYYIDGVFFAVTYATPFTLNLDSAKLTAGEHILVAKAYDAAGNSTASKQVTVTVASQAVAAGTAGGSITLLVTNSKATASKTTANTSNSSGTPSGGGTTTPPEPTDSAAPSTPGNLVLSASSAYVATTTWTASTDNTAVSGYRVYRDGSLLGTTSTTNYIDYTVVPGNTYVYQVVAYDAAQNTAASTSPTITLATVGIWMDFDRPLTFGNDGIPLELGVKFKPRVDGKITGVRFYKASGDPGTHTGRLWASNGTPLANAVFSNETASGWQEVTFVTPVDVTANTTYVASYTSPNGRYSSTADYFEDAGITSEYLSAPISGGADGTNGVFSTTGGAFPTSSFNDSNYWVDVAFIPNPGAGGPTPSLADSSQVFSGYPGSDNTGVVGTRLPRRDRVDLVTGMTVSNVAVETDFFAVKVNNVTFDHVKFTYTGALDASFTLINIQSGVTGTTFLDVEVDGQSKVERGIYGINDVIVRRSNIHHVGNGIEVSDNITAEDNYIHDIFTPSGMTWHADGIQSASSASDLIINHNTIFVTSNETGAVNFVGSSPGSGGTFTNVSVNNNLMAGGSYTVYVGGDTNTNVSVTNNKFSTRYHPTVGNFNIYYMTFMTGVTVSGNTIFETGAPANVNF